METESPGAIAANSVTVASVAVPGAFTLFAQRGASVSAGTNLANLPFHVWLAGPEELARPPLEERADVAAELLASLDDAAAERPADVEAAWAAEIERRARRALADESGGVGLGRGATPP